MTAPDFREALARTIRDAGISGVTSDYIGPFDQARADAVLALLAERPGGDEVREVACVVMHDAYEVAAAKSGWETQERSRVPWADVPEANKATMRAAVDAALAALRDHLGVQG